MTYHGHIKDGVIILDAPVDAPDGTPVRVAVERADGNFWQHKSLDELAAEQAIEPLRTLDDLAGDWPPEDSLDEFLEMIRKVRA